MEVNKSGLKIIQDNIYYYMYTKKYARKTAVRWECSNRVAFSCKADYTTDLEMKTVPSSTRYIHNPHDTAFSATKLRTTTPERTGSFLETLTFTGITSNPHIEVCSEFGNSETIKWSLRRENYSEEPKPSRRSCLIRWVDQDQRWRQWCRLTYSCTPGATYLWAFSLELLEPTIPVKSWTMILWSSLVILIPLISSHWQTAKRSSPGP